MSADTLFTLANISIVPFWLLLAFAPYWRWTDRLVHTFILPQVLSVVYLVLAVGHFFGGDGGFDSLQGVAVLFANPYALTAGWIHYLVFDLFVGAWVARDARRLSIPHLAVLPCLFFTFMMGPVGLLMYTVLRATLRRRVALGDRELAFEPA